MVSPLDFVDSPFPRRGGDPSSSRSSWPPPGRNRRVLPFGHQRPPRRRFAPPAGRLHSAVLAPPNLLAAALPGLAASLGPRGFASLHPSRSGRFAPGAIHPLPLKQRNLRLLQITCLPFFTCSMAPPSNQRTSPFLARHWCCNSYWLSGCD